MLNCKQKDKRRHNELGRHYKVPRFNRGSKEARTIKEEKARSDSYQALSTQEKLIHAIVLEYGMELMDAVAHERVVDESKYAKRINEIIGGNNG